MLITRLSSLRKVTNNLSMIKSITAMCQTNIMPPNITTIVANNKNTLKKLLAN